MAIEFDTNTTQAKSNPTQAQPQRQQSSIDLFGGDVFGSVLPTNTGGEVLNKLANALREKYKESTASDSIQVITLDKSADDLAFSTVLVCVRSNRLVAVQPLILEITGEAIMPLSENIMGQKVDIIRTAEDTVDNIYLNAIESKLTAALPGSTILMVRGMVVPKSFNADDKDAIHRLATNSGLACMTKLETSNASFLDVNLAEAASSDNQLRIELSFNNPNRVSVVGLPIRSDMVVDFGVTAKSTNNNRSIHGSGSQFKKIFSVSGYVDLLWAPAETGGGYNPYAQQQAMNTQKYAANVIITDIESSKAYTIGSMLLSIAAALTVRDNNNWIQYFRPQITKGVDTRDIGALNVECNLLNQPANEIPMPLPTKDANFSLTDLGGMIAAMIQPNILVSMDISKASSASWYMSVFKDAAANDQDAINAIIKAANRLTNNAFSNYFHPGTAMFVNVDHIHTGYYIDSNGSMRDIREIDYLAVANYVGGRNPQLVRDYSDTINRRDFPVPLRLQSQLKIIESLCSDNIVITGISQRVTFSHAFLQALTTGIRETGTAVQVITPLNSADFSNTRAVATYVNDGAVAGGTPLWNQRSSYGGNNYGGNGNSYYG
jgi:hypothetical protein